MKILKEIVTGGAIKKFDETYYNVADDIKLNQINIRVGGRGLGKTFSGYRFIIDKFINTGAKFVIIRRQQSDFASLFSDIACYYPGKFKYAWDRRTGITTIYYNDELCGFLLSLSCGVKYKSHYFDVDYILFDEFIKSAVEKRISDDECFLFLEILETIARDRINITCMLFSNATIINNDYFDMWNISIDELVDDRKIQVNPVVNAELLVSTDDYYNRKKKTLTYMASQGTKYFEYAYNNNFNTSNLPYYVKENNSKVLPSSKDFYFYYKKEFYHVSDKFISPIAKIGIPKGSVCISYEMEGLMNINIVDKLKFIQIINTRLYEKLNNHTLFFSTLKTATKLSDLIIGEVV